MSGRNATEVASIAKELGALGCACDVAQYDDVETLWAAATSKYGAVDLWINNAGTGNVPAFIATATPRCGKSNAGCSIHR